MAIASSVAVAAATAPAWGSFSGTYTVRFIHPRDAVGLLQARVPELNSDCKIDPQEALDPTTAGQRGVVRISCGQDTVRAKIEQALAEIDVPAPTQKLHVVVLEASRKDGGTPALPASELKALDDFRKVMTYKSFRLEGETVVQLNEQVKTQINDSFNLEIVVGSTRGTVTAIEVRRFRLSSNVPQPAGKDNVTYRMFFDTAFSVKQGETIVLGASASAETARVVLVTALP
jgi:hypothetical protein